MNRKTVFKRFACLLLAGLFTIGATGGGALAADAVTLENLMRSESEVADGVEIIVSVVEIGPNSSLSKHYHPGEEYVYVLDGSATLWLKGKSDVKMQAGDLFKIPLQQVHTAITSDSGAKALVFRVHRKGEPERIAAE